MNAIGDILSGSGFDAAQLRFALRTAIAACIALVLAWALRLEHPQWAAMTVWAASQPTRGQLLEKGFFRLVGTLIGVVAGVALVVMAHGNNLILVCGLAVWIGLSAGAGNLLRGFFTYGAMLSGYSAAMVALLDTGGERAFALGLDRMTTIFVGVVTALVIGLLFAPATSTLGIDDRLRRLTARILKDMAQCLLHGPERIAQDLPQLLSEMATIEEMLEPHGAGSLRSRRFIRSARALLVAGVSVLLWLRNGPSRHWPDSVAEELEKAAEVLEESGDIAKALAALERVVSTCGPDAAISKSLAPLSVAIRRYLGLPGAEREEYRRAYPLILHTDWAGARQSFIRATVAMLLVGFGWIVTGWSSGPFMLLGLSIMVTIFSTFENPAHTLRFVAAGQAAGIVGALLCRWLVWPHASGSFEPVLMVMPFIIFGAFFASHRKTAPFGFDYNMVSLLLLKPALPLMGTFAASLETGLAVLAGPLAALVVFRVIYPMNARKRIRNLETTIVEELVSIAKTPRDMASRAGWRGRLYYRLLRLVRMQEKAGGDLTATVSAGLAVLNIGTILYDLHQRNGDATLSATERRAIRLVLARASVLDRKPIEASTAFVRASGHVWNNTDRAPHPLHRAAADIKNNAAFFKMAS